METIMDILNSPTFWTAVCVELFAGIPVVIAAVIMCTRKDY
jgi:hypothetical protein